MPLITDADLDFALADMGVAVTSPQSSTNGMLRIEDALEQDPGSGAPIQKRVTTLTIRTGSITDLNTDLPVTAGGTNYVVRWWDEHDDGRLTKVLLAKVTP